MNKIYVNGHFLHQRVTGVQRFAREVLAGFDRGGYAYKVLDPPPFYKSNKLTQHFWEQIVLPRRLEEQAVLWSPTDTGPLYFGNHVITLHDIAVFAHPECFSASYARWKQALLLRMVRRVKKIITVSKFSKKMICEYLNVHPENVHVAYNGVDTTRFKPLDDKTVQKTLLKYGISSPYLLTLGSLDPRKNFPRLIEAWNRCIDAGKISNYSLVVAGGRNSNFRNLELSESRFVKLSGYVDDKDLPAFYSGATAFLLPSLFEGFGLPIIEAMACGTPVLTSDTTALDEVAGDAALKVSPANTESISDGIMQLLDSRQLRERLIDEGFKRIKKFDWNETASSIYGHLRA